MIEFDPKRDLAAMGLKTDTFRCGLDNDADWCEHIERMMKAGADAVMLHTDLHIAVPIFPTQKIFGDVWIGVDVGNGSAIMSLNYTPDIGRPYSVRLGFWNPGEGMASIRAVILDYLYSKLDPEESVTSVGPIKTKCPATVHGLPEMKAMNEKCGDPLWRWGCLWNIVMEKACTPCIEASSGGGGNFGIDPDALNQGNSRPWQ